MMRPEDAGAESAWADAALDTSLSGGLSAPPYPPQPPQPLTESPAPMSGAYHNKPGIYTGGLTTPPRGRSPADPEHDSLSISAAPAAVQTAERYAHQLRQRYQLVLDRATLFPAQRWGLTTGVLLVFILRVLICEGWWYLVCYALFIFLLSRFLLFLTPKFDPSFDEDQEVDDLEAGGREPPSAQQASSKGLMNGMFEPASPEDEFRPFVRRLPEFTFWLSATQATLLSLGASFFAIFDVPVFWPILLLYFIILLALTMRRQIKHMIKYRYIPFDLGRKATY